MKLCRFEPMEASGKVFGRTQAETYRTSHAGMVENSVIREISGELWGERKPTGREFRVNEVRFLPPSWPTKIICMARNYLDHAAEMNVQAPQQPVIFSKPLSAIIAPLEEIVMPRISKRVDYEGELAFIIGRRCSRPKPSEDIAPYILGYTCLNDVTARDLQRLDGQFTRGKGFDTFCPFGPVVDTERPSADTKIETFVNGAKKQSAHVSDMVFGIDAIFRWIAEAMTLEPGDVIATGTPAGVGPLTAGDVVEVRVGDIGMLRNTVVGPRD